MSDTIYVCERERSETGKRENEGTRVRDITRGHTEGVTSERENE